MRVDQIVVTGVLVKIRFVFFAALLSIAGHSTTALGAAAAEKPDASVCLGCHGNEGFEMPGADGKMKSLHVPPAKFEKSEIGRAHV